MWVTLSVFSIRIALNASLGSLQDLHGDGRHNRKAWSRSCGPVEHLGSDMCPAFATARTIQLECREPASRLIPRE
ncbi:hypothetical protein C8R45DRAFT_995732 [Mycena sanguinolenta]|nr:hypothetical protein C8R45DRAFT_995732 [Mycena sanguinolenta]